MGIRFGRILMPYGWSGPRHTYYKVEGKRGATQRVNYGSTEVELQVLHTSHSGQLLLANDRDFVAKIEWAKETGGVALRDLRVVPQCQGLGLAKILGWLALRDIHEAGLSLEGARAEGVMEAKPDAEADPRAATLFTKLGFNCLDRARQEQAAQLVSRPADITVSGSEEWPHYKMSSPFFGTLRLALMTPEGIRTRDGVSRGILQDRGFYETFLREGVLTNIFSEVILRGAAYISGNYFLDPELTEILTEQVKQLPPLST